MRHAEGTRPRQQLGRLCDRPSQSRCPSAPRTTNSETHPAGHVVGKQVDETLRTQPDATGDASARPHHAGASRPTSWRRSRPPAALFMAARRGPWQRSQTFALMVITCSGARAAARATRSGTWPSSDSLPSFGSDLRSMRKTPASRSLVSWRGLVRAGGGFVEHCLHDVAE